MLTSYTYMSLDGIVSSPEKWVAPYFSAEMGEDLTRRLRSAVAMVLGRQTYSEFAEFWPRQGSAVPFADLNNGIRKYVVSGTLDQAKWRNSSVVRIDDIGSLKSQGDLHITGSARLVRGLLERRVLDELVVLVCPVVVGNGRRLLEGVEATGLDLVKLEPFPLGVLSLTYRPAR